MQFSFAQGKTVTGVVSDNTGPIPGANVVVKGKHELHKQTLMENILLKQK